MAKTILIAGADGMVGEHVLRHCLESSNVSQLTLVGPRPVPVEASNLVQVQHDDFLDFSPVQDAFRGVDSAVFCVSDRTGAPPEDLRRHAGFTESFARTVAQESPRASFVFLSAQGADPDEKSSDSLARYKGMAENALLNLGFPRLDIFRPGYIYPTIPHREPNWFSRVFRLFYPAIAKVYPNVGISSDDLGWALAEIAANEPFRFAGPIWENREIRVLASTRNSWMPHHAGSLAGKTFLVTGANTGLGLETAKMLAKGEAQVIMACRSQERGSIAQAEVATRYPQGKVDLELLDLGSLASVQEFAHKISEKYPQLDGLVNNAGIMMCPYQLTKDGFEFQIGVNHLGHFALTARLMPLLQAAPSARIVNVSSIAHRKGEMDFDNLLYENGGYNPGAAYRRSKLANLLFTLELQRRLQEAGSSVMAVAAHPGVSSTELARGFEGGGWRRRIIKLVFRLAQPAFLGALPQVRALLDPDVRGGEYYGPDGFREMSGLPVRVEPEPHAKNAEDARTLWQMSEELTGVSFQLG